MVNATISDGNRSYTTNQRGEMERKYKDDGSTTRMKIIVICNMCNLMTEI
jgi:hypothetical protein